MKKRHSAEQMGDGEGGVRRMPGPMGMFEMGRLIGKAPSKPGEYPFDLVEGQDSGLIQGPGSGWHEGTSNRLLTSLLEQGLFDV